MVKEIEDIDSSVWLRLCAGQELPGEPASWGFLGVFYIPNSKEAEGVCY